MFGLKNSSSQRRPYKSTLYLQLINSPFQFLRGSVPFILIFEHVLAKSIQAYFQSPFILAKNWHVKLLPKQNASVTPLLKTNNTSAKGSLLLFMAVPLSYQKNNSQVRATASKSLPIAGWQNSENLKESHESMVDSMIRL